MSKNLQVPASVLSRVNGLHITTALGENGLHVTTALGANGLHVTTTLLSGTNGLHVTTTLMSGANGLHVTTTSPSPVKACILLQIYWKMATSSTIT